MQKSSTNPKGKQMVLRNKKILKNALAKHRHCDLCLFIS